jgi:hypothetical protein
MAAKEWEIENGKESEGGAELWVSARAANDKKRTNTAASS